MKTKQKKRTELLQYFQLPYKNSGDYRGIFIIFCGIWKQLINIYGLTYTAETYVIIYINKDIVMPDGRKIRILLEVQ